MLAIAGMAMVGLPAKPVIEKMRRNDEQHRSNNHP